MKLAKMMICLVLAAVLLLPAPAQAAPAGGQVLLLYDSLAKGTSREGNVTELQRLLAAFSVTVTLQRLKDYEKGTMAAYSRIITVSNSADLPLNNRAYLEDLKDYHGQALHIGYNLPGLMKSGLQLSTAVWPSGIAVLSIGDLTGLPLKVEEMPYITAHKAGRAYGTLSLQEGSLELPYAVSSGQYTYVPYLEQDNGSVTALAYVLRDWLQAAAEPHMYLVLKEIYPFSDLNLLEQAAERLYESGIPFIASIRPVFSNTDFPAMERYMEALKIVQSRGGSIMVNAPAVRPPINSSDRTLKGKMAGFINVLAAGGVAPLGIGAEGYWAYDREYSAAGMGFFDSAALFPDEEIHYMEQLPTSEAFRSSLYSMTPESLQELSGTGIAAPELPLNVAVTLNLPEDEDGLAAMLQSLKASWITFDDYRQEAHTVLTDDNTVTARDGVIMINGEAVNTDYVPKAVSSDYQYQEEQVRSFTRLFSVQNRFFIVVIIIALLFFGGLLLIGRRLYRRKYFK
ncbi:hypothetical protein C2I18_11105 [Paenibacillus sp. PK3_47]|uniref:hypothetical protein n=1 Tax=Paenibacillus sp. PK3_47 TaxID=2072642 RepID=UPI00201DCEBE|nr:hypothetical protein [Paenibacillus sp. PK3_47]UQZ34029.1 hypothetical protein C2I18_11105 [Paenibacillus sp. PK3_47]